MLSADFGGESRRAGTLQAIDRLARTGFRRRDRVRRSPPDEERGRHEAQRDTGEITNEIKGYAKKDAPEVAEEDAISLRKRVSV
jgi:hypothetical protein